MPPQDPQVVLQDPNTAATLANVYADSNGDLLLHEADSGNEVKVSANGFDLNGNALTDTTQGFLDLTGDGNDLRLATGQSIEDGSGTTRVSFGSNSTVLNDNAGTESFAMRDGSYNRIYATDSKEAQVFDGQGSFIGARYFSFASPPGILQMTNANLDMLGQTITDSSQGFVDMTGDGNDLRLATNQEITDGSGVGRFRLESNLTEMKDDAGTRSIVSIDGGSTALYAEATRPVRIFDNEGSFTAVDYVGSATQPGTLELTNAALTTAGTAIGVGAAPTGPDREQITFHDRGVAAGAGPTGGANLYAVSGELRAKDDAGNETVLT